MAYTKQFLVNVFLYRFRILDQDKIDQMRVLGERCYDEEGRDKFRIRASVTPEAIREYNAYVADGGDPDCSSIKLRI